MSSLGASSALACVLFVAACSTDDAPAGAQGASNDAAPTQADAMGSSDTSASQETSTSAGADAAADSLSVDVAAPDAMTADHPDGSPIDLAVSLQGARWELPCGATVEDGRVCQYATTCDGTSRTNIDKTIAFGGSVGTVYDVQVRIRGVVEPRKYLGGQADGTHFRTGGLPDPDASTNLYAVYSIEVSSPKQIYYYIDTVISIDSASAGSTKARELVDCE